MGIVLGENPKLYQVMWEIIVAPSISTTCITMSGHLPGAGSWYGSWNCPKSQVENKRFCEAFIRSIQAFVSHPLMQYLFIGIILHFKTTASFSRSLCLIRSPGNAIWPISTERPWVIAPAPAMAIKTRTLFVWIRQSKPGDFEWVKKLRFLRES